MKNIFSKGGVAIFLAAVMLLSATLSGCDKKNSVSGDVPENKKEQSEDRDESKYQTEKLTLSSEKMGMSFNTTVKINFNRYIKEDFDFTVEDAELKKFVFAALMDAHDIGVANLESAPNTDETNNEIFLNKWGFTNVECVFVGGDAYEDEKDTVKAVIAAKTVDSDTIINVALCGTDNADEWASNFDFGSDTEGYKGAHSEWTNKINHKGFDVAANRVVAKIKEYIQSADIKKAPLIVVSGYSRGAAVANLVAAKIADDSTVSGIPGARVTAYTFATPRTTVADDNAVSDGKYKCIHNYVNEDDSVTELPPKSMGFKRYGTDHSFSVQQSEELKAKFKTIVGRDYNASVAPTVQKAINSLITDRDQAYNIIEDEAHKSYKIDDVSNTTESAAQKAGEAFLKQMEEKGVGKYFKDAGVTEAKSAEGVRYYIWSCYVSDEILIKIFNTMISKIMGGNIKEALADNYLLEYSRHKTTVGALIFKMSQNLNYFGDTHLPVGYYLACFNE